MHIKLSTNQERAIKLKDGPCLVLSGPGSGKTFVITNRIVYLISKYKIDAENILIITFTKAAANEMETRFYKIIKDNKILLKSRPTFGTFHSIFFSILRNDFEYKLDSLITIDEKKIIINNIINKLQKNLRVKNNNSYLVSCIIKEIDNYKLCKERNEVFQSQFFNKNEFIWFIDEYQKELDKKKKLDYFDMIDICRKKLICDKDVLKKYQNKYKYILIDEFQDINKSQYELIKLINAQSNIFAVGDDDQSIYGFRGASPEILNKFLKDYKFAKKIYLTENYRCAKLIVKLSKLVIDYNKLRFKKRFIAKNDEIGKLEIKAFVDSNDENDYIIDLIEKYRNIGVNLSDIAILYRTNILSQSIEEKLIKKNFNYLIKNTPDKEKSETNAITLTTFHLSKGLEFKVVFIIDANDGIVPHKKSILSHDIEMERRLFYVAITRAKSYLHIFFTVRRFGKDYKISRFLLEAIGEKNGKKRYNFSC